MFYLCEKKNLYFSLTQYAVFISNIIIYQSLNLQPFSTIPDQMLHFILRPIANMYTINCFIIETAQAELGAFCWGPLDPIHWYF